MKVKGIEPFMRFTAGAMNRLYDARREGFYVFISGIWWEDRVQGAVRELEKRFSAWNNI